MNFDTSGRATYEISSTRRTMSTSCQVTCGRSPLATRLSQGTGWKCATSRRNGNVPYLTCIYTHVDRTVSSLRRDTRGRLSLSLHSTSPDKEDTPPAAGETAPVASPREDDEPIWVRREREREMLAKQGGNKDLPFGVYLLLSSIVAIAAVGSIFEFVNQNPIFDVIQPDSPFYVPILGTFSVTGIPTAGYLFIKAVGAANAEAERMDKLDGVESKDNYFNRKE